MVACFNFVNTNEEVGDAGSEEGRLRVNYCHARSETGLITDLPFFERIYEDQNDSICTEAEVVL